METRLLALLEASPSCTLLECAPAGPLGGQVLWVLYVFEGRVLSMSHQAAYQRGDRVALDDEEQLLPDETSNYCLVRCEASTSSVAALRCAIGRRQLSPAELWYAEALAKLYLSQGGSSACQRHLALALLSACAPPEADECPPRLQRLLEWMEEHCAEELSIDVICRQSQYNRAYLGRLFQRWVGFAPLEYLRHLRVQKAQRLLVQTDLPVKEISSISGYSEPQVFFRHFKQVSGMTPTAYRSAETARQRRNPLCMP